MPERTEEKAAARAGRCANHPSVPSVGTCEVCGRSLCAACVVPVRGRLIGPECLPTILEDITEPPTPPAPVRSHWDTLAMAGFGIVVLVSLFPWSRFGEGSHFLGAWRLRWSLVAVLAALAGVGIAFLGRYRPFDLRLEATAIAVLAAVAGVAALIDYSNPPLLSESTLWPVVAVIGAAVAMAGAVATLTDVVRARRPVD